MRYLRQLKLQKKIGASFALLIAMIVVNAAVSGLAAYLIAQQIGLQNRVEQVFGEVDKVRLQVSRFVNSHSRESAQLVFLGLEATRQQIEAAHQGLDDEHLQGMLPLLDDFRLHFQKHTVQAEQTSALESQALMLGQRMVAQLNEIRGSAYARAHRATLDALESQMLALQWDGQARRSTWREPSMTQTDSIRQALARLQDSSQNASGHQGADRLLFRILRDANDYVSSFESYSRYQRLNAVTEKKLSDISDTIQQDCKRVSISVSRVIQTRIYQAIGLMLLMFLLSMFCAVVLTGYLTREILRPVRALINITHEIASGRLQARASVLVEDEIGELSRSFNQMTQSLDESRTELLEKQAALEGARAELEQRVQQRTGQLELANQTLAARELLVRQIIDTAPIAIFLVDMTGRITQANTHMVEMFGYPMEVLVGMEYMALVDPTELEMRRATMLALMNSEIAIVDLDRKYRRASGAEFWAHLTGKLFCDTTGKKLGLVGVIADITALKAHQQQLENMAHFDALTQLPNRLLLADRLQQAMLQSQRRNNMLAVAYLDLDGFKTVNDTHGHDAGDELLVALAQRMKDTLREGDTLARIGGDEFVAVLADLQQAQDCEPLLTRLLQAAFSPVAISTPAGPIELQVSVNIGARQLQQEGFATRLSEVLADYPDVPPHCLQLEVLETSALEDIAKVSAVMTACQNLGVGFALDDFGTGYSSLTYLKRLPVETLKIDQSFVRDMLEDPSDLAIVNGVIGLAKAFDRQVIAEGVETAAHGELLLSIGCQLAQGYGIARPMPAAGLSSWVAQWHLAALWTA